MKNEWVIGEEPNWRFVKHLRCGILESKNGKTYFRHFKMYDRCWHCKKQWPKSLIRQLEILYG